MAQKQIPDLRQLTHDPIMIGSLRVMMFQGGILLFAVGIIQILSAIDVIELIGIAQYFPLGIIVLNFSTFLFITDVVHRDLLKITIPQIIIFMVIIGLQLLSL